jgi:phosphomannomutase / phosphoglucomutase
VNLTAKGSDILTMKPRQDLTANTLAYEQFAFVKPTGFREYDARWLFEKEINLAGIQQIGLGIGTLMHERGVRPDIVVGHDYRSYSSAIKYALISGLMAAGVRVHDIGLATTPMAYFAQFALDVPAVAMVTASHNDNGWTGIKMGMNRPLTFGPDEMLALKNLVLEGRTVSRAGGGLVNVVDFYAQYRADLTKGAKLSRKLRVAAVCGNGTAGAFAPQVLRDLGCEVIEVDCGLDHSFPNYNPNPEDLEMLHVMANAVKEHGLDVAFGFDGDGDRCGVSDNEGHEIFADKIGLMIARDIASQTPRAKFVVDVKSTGLFKADPVLTALGATVDYWKTGHSYIKQRTNQLDAAAGFEKSGHFFFRPPYGHGYDDGIVSAIAILRMLDRAPDQSMADLYRALPKSWATPTMSPHCDDLKKYGVVDALIAKIKMMAETKALINGQAIVDVNTVNGVRFTFADHSWGLIRASSNKPELVIVCESMTSEAQMISIFRFIEGLLAQHPEVGAFNQKI